MLGDLVGAIKKAALQAYENSDPATWMLGEVVNDDPLEIEVEQRLTLDEDNLILTRNVTDYMTFASFNMKTESADGHKHSITGQHPITIHNSLQEGDLVLLIRQQGGQKFIVIDRVVYS